jgi:hypothetical protein
MVFLGMRWPGDSAKSRAESSQRRRARNLARLDPSKRRPHRLRFLLLPALWCSHGIWTPRSCHSASSTMMFSPNRTSGLCLRGRHSRLPAPKCAEKREVLFLLLIDLRRNSLQSKPPRMLTERYGSGLRVCNRRTRADFLLYTAFMLSFSPETASGVIYHSI